jgi:hypothetical protein
MGAHRVAVRRSGAMSWNRTDSRRRKPAGLGACARGPDVGVPALHVAAGRADQIIGWGKRELAKAPERTVLEE